VQASVDSTQTQIREDPEGEPLAADRPDRSGRRRQSGKESALQARFRRVLRHRGPKKAVVALAHTLLPIVYHILADGTVDREIGGDYHDRQHRQRVTRRAILLLERQGYRVTLEPAA
jgi:hypothetical protein